MSHDVARDTSMEVKSTFPRRHGDSSCIYCCFGLSPVAEPRLLDHVNWSVLWDWVGVSWPLEQRDQLVALKVGQGCFPWSAAFLFMLCSPLSNELK